jgi:uncharacterized protein
MSEYKIPGVYIEEQSVFPPSVSATATAVPAFLGYTTLEVAEPFKISSLMEFETIFGLPPVSAGPVVTLPARPGEGPGIDWSAARSYHLYYYVEHYFRNGGGPCYVLSAGVAGPDYPTTADGYIAALNQLKKLDEPTLIVLTDALVTLEGTGNYGVRHAKYFDVVNAAMQQCGALQDRFVIMDMPLSTGELRDDVATFRGKIVNYPSYGAAYYPYLDTTLTRRPIFTYSLNAFRDSTHQSGFSGFLAVANRFPILSYTGVLAPSVVINKGDNNPDAASFSITSDAQSRTLVLTVKNDATYSATQLLEAFAKLADPEGFVLLASTYKSNKVSAKGSDLRAPDIAAGTTLLSGEQLQQDYPAIYAKAVAAIARTPLVLPPAPAVAGVYASVDRDRGVWKSPANVGLSATNGPVALLGQDDQALFNVDETAGRSVNCILNFTGKGTLVWGARTLDAGNLDWRYIAVRRLFIMIEESVKKAAQFAVFEPNDKSTWSKVKAMINNYLYSIWQKGGLMGGKPEEAYFVQVGLGETMSAQDILDGKMIVQVGLAPVRPAEFIIIRFSQMQQTA